MTAAVGNCSDDWCMYLTSNVSSTLVEGVFINLTFIIQLLNPNVAADG
jgi:hypothetical protein